MTYDSKEFDNMLKAFRNNRNWTHDVSIDIEDDVNSIDPLLLLRYYEQDASLDTSMAITTQMIMNKHVVFKKADTIIHEFTYTGGDLGAKFTDKPYLLDMLLKMCYGIMIKKLTPPSDD